MNGNPDGGRAAEFDLGTIPKIVPHGVVPAERLTGKEQMWSRANGATGPSIMGLWQWSSSNLLDNTMRGILAEYIVAYALGAADEGTRTEWDAFDVVTRSGIKVEVKSSAFIQSWAQEKSSAASIQIRETLAWNADTSKYETDRRRQADVYVICIFTGTDTDRDSVLDLDLWTFLVVPTHILNTQFPGQKTVRLSVLAKTEDIVRCEYDDLEQAVEAAGAEGRSEY